MKKTTAAENTTPVNINPEDFPSLSQPEQVAALQAMNGAMQLRMIANLPNPEQFVTSLPLPDIYRIFSKVGPDQTLLTLASPEQLRLILDLELWDEWSLSTEETLKWLESILETGDRQALRILTQLDPELLLVFLKKNMTVGGGLGDIIHSEDFQGEWDHTFDEIFFLHFLEEESGQLILRMLELLYTEHHALYRSLMLGVENELLSELEEAAWQFRAGRLADEGLPPGAIPADLLSINPEH
jgi:hypothetical protein